MSSGKLVVRLVRHLWQLRGRFEGQREGLLTEIATALDTVLRSNRIGRAALGAYRLAMRVLLAGGVLLVLAGAALAGGLRDSTVAVVLGIAIAALGVFAGWQWWTWSAGLRFLKRNVDPARRAPPEELPARFAQLASDARPTSDRLGAELDELGRALRDDR